MFFRKIRRWTRNKGSEGANFTVLKPDFLRKLSGKRKKDDVQKSLLPLFKIPDRNYERSCSTDWVLILACANMAVPAWFRIVSFV